MLLTAGMANGHGDFKLTHLLPRTMSDPGSTFLDLKPTQLLPVKQFKRWKKKYVQATLLIVLSRSCVHNVLLPNSCLSPTPTQLHDVSC